MNALVLGLGVSGEAAAAAIEARGGAVVRADRSLGNDDDASLLDGVEVLVKGPGVPSRNALVQAALARGVPVWSELELGFRLLPGNPVLAVTGTKGKTTTVRLLAAIFAAAGVEHALAGNEHRPLSEVAGGVEAGAWILCEASSYALEHVDTFAAEVAVLLNLEPDHLVHHGSFEAYRAAKLRIFERAGTAILAGELNSVNDVYGNRCTRFTADDPLPAEPRLPGRHNRANAAAATAAARAAGIDDAAIAEALRSFAGVEHRLELVAERGGVRFVDDSKATNTAAARTALRAYDAPLHLILGGSLKGESYDELAREIAARGEVSPLLIGVAADEIGAALDRAGVAYERAQTLDRAVALAAARARPGDVVLLSPACASFDQFENFERRGEEFRRLVQNL
ncbi:MAG TPA: Mur ligase family protein [Gaiellaceae bacterium]|nr:Mur ligase family protein [Gaiellaceae bacterium]